VPSLVARGPTERVYEIAIDNDARASVHFGDGMEGARPPSGDHNIRSRYRKGLGLAGNVAAGKLTSLLSRPLGVMGAGNPEAASGGEDPEHQEKARDNAPLTVRTLDRAVSIRDYQDFAQAYPGIAKAHALWIASGPSRGVFLTVAGEQGAAVRRTSDTYRNLQAALHRYGDPLMPIRLASYRRVPFVVRLTVKVQADADSALVLPAIRSRLAEVFGFDRRRLGQGTSVDEVTAVAHAVAGVEAVHVVELHRGLASIARVARRLFAALPIDSLTTAPSPAELLTIDTAHIVLEPMP
jgi:predicted phage baseplate assembly protein